MNDKGLEPYVKEILVRVKDWRFDNSDIPKITADISQQISEACNITQLSLHDLLVGLDFKPEDKTIEALEGFIAELRAIFWLNNFGFSEIQPLPAQKKTSRPDFIMKHGNKNCATEVFCLTGTHEQKKNHVLNVHVNFDPQFEGSKFGRDFLSKANKKKLQLDSGNYDLKILLCTANGIINVFNKSDDWEKHVKFLHEKLSWGEEYYTGVCTSSGNFVYPKFK